MRLERKWTYTIVDNLLLSNALLRSNFYFSFHYPKRKINDDGENERMPSKLRNFRLPNTTAPAPHPSPSFFFDKSNNCVKNPLFESKRVRKR